MLLGTSMGPSGICSDDGKEGVRQGCIAHATRTRVGDVPKTPPTTLADPSPQGTAPGRRTETAGIFGGT